MDDGENFLCAPLPAPEKDHRPGTTPLPSTGRCRPHRERPRGRSAPKAERSRLTLRPTQSVHGRRRELPMCAPPRTGEGPPPRHHSPPLHGALPSSSRTPSWEECAEGGEIALDSPAHPERSWTTERTFYVRPSPHRRRTTAPAPLPSPPRGAAVLIENALVGGVRRRRRDRA